MRRQSALPPFQTGSIRLLTNPRPPEMDEKAGVEIPYFFEKGFSTCFTTVSAGAPAGSSGLPSAPILGGTGDIPPGIGGPPPGGPPGIPPGGAPIPPGIGCMRALCTSPTSDPCTCIVGIIPGGIFVGSPILPLDPPGPEERFVRNQPVPPISRAAAITIPAATGLEISLLNDIS